MKLYRWLLCCLLVSAMPFMAGISAAQDQKAEGGWAKDGAYNRHYDLNEVDDFKATVVGIKTQAPMPGMSPGVLLLVRESNDAEIIEVQVCPLWFAKPGRIGVRKGDRVKIRGAWAEIDGRDVIMAAKIKTGEHREFKVRKTSDGTPFWTMTPEERAKETRSE